MEVTTIAPKGETYAFSSRYYPVENLPVRTGMDARVTYQTNLRRKLDINSLIPFKGVASVKGQLAVDPEHLNRTVDGVDVHQTNSAGCGSHYS
jgi:hypothetical protein